MVIQSHLVVTITCIGYSFFLKRGARWVLLREGDGGKGSDTFQISFFELAVCSSSCFLFDILSSQGPIYNFCLCLGHNFSSVQSRTTGVLYRLQVLKNEVTRLSNTLSHVGWTTFNFKLKKPYGNCLTSCHSFIASSPSYMNAG